MQVVSETSRMGSLGKKLAILVAGGLSLLGAQHAQAEGVARDVPPPKFTSTNVQLLYGDQFDDFITGNATTDEEMKTLTLEHFSTWEYGDNFFFTDFTAGNFIDGSKDHIYGEWHPRLSLSKLTGVTVGGGIVRDTFLASEINLGSAGSFEAYLVGLGMEFNIPHVPVLGVNVYYRNDNFNKGTYQVSPYWHIPIPIGPTNLVLDGFVDVSGTDSIGTDIMAQPQILLDLLPLVGGPANRLQAGVEWYYHKNDLVETSAPQAMVKWYF